MYKVGRSRTPQGVRGLKPETRPDCGPAYTSHSARSAWIETGVFDGNLQCRARRTPQGVRGLKLHARHTGNEGNYVALRKECVD